MNKKAHRLYNEMSKAENDLLAIRSRLLREEWTPELAAIRIREVSIKLAELAVSIFAESPKG